MLNIPRCPRIQAPGAYYHVTSRGTAKQPIFIDDNDRRFFERILAQVVLDHAWRCNSYCLMNNHFHLMLETPEPNLSIGMKYLNGVYSQRFNVRHERVGHLMQGRFFSRLINGDSCYLALARYIVLNPVRAGLCRTAGEWRWSSYRAIAGLVTEPPYLDTEFLHGMFARDKTSAAVQYAEFVRLSEDIEPSLARQEMKTLLDRMEADYSVSLEQLFNREMTKNERNLRICDAYLKYGYPMRRIADYLGINVATVSRAVKRARESENATQGV
jgi:putative transposase